MTAHPTAQPITSTHVHGTPAWLSQLLAQLATWAGRLARDRARLDRVQAQDLAQETVCRLLARYGSDTLASLPAPVLRSIAWRSLRNLVIDESRRWRPRTIGHPVELTDAGPPADVQLDAVRARERLEAALATLAHPEREFLLAAMRLDSVLAAQKAVGWPRASPYYQLGLLLDRLRDVLLRPARAH